MKFIKIMLLGLLGLTVVLIAAIFIIGYAVSAPGYKGPVSDHFNGETFFTPGMKARDGEQSVFKWMLTRKRSKWKTIKEENFRYGPKPASRIDSGQVITFVNHSTFLIQTDSLNILTDPVWSKRVSPVSFIGPKRNKPAGIRFEDLPDIDLVLLSHNHYDHLDISTLKKIKQIFDPLFIVPLGVDLYLNEEGIPKTVSLDWWQKHGVSDSVSVDCVPAQHFSSRGLFDRNQTLWAGYIIHSPKGKIYFAGDSGYGEFFKEIGTQYAPVKTALIPIGAYKPTWFMGPVHVSPEEALQVFHDVGAQNGIGMHFGTFQLADDGLTDPIMDLDKALNGENFRTLKEGESITLK